MFFLVLFRVFLCARFLCCCVFVVCVFCALIIRFLCYVSVFSFPHIYHIYIVFFNAGVTTPEGMIGDEELERAIEDEYERVMQKTKNAKKREERERLIQLGGGELHRCL